MNGDLPGSARKPAAPPRRAEAEMLLEVMKCRVGAAPAV